MTETDVASERLNLPTGTVTFLLTDVAGSTRMWGAEPDDAMRAAIRRHYEILSRAVESHDGVRPQEQGEGDSIVAAFARPSDALAAATFVAELSRDGYVAEVAGSVRAARFAFGGLAATVKRAAGAEAAVSGQPWSEATLRAAQSALDRDFKPLSDLRASADYRRQAARGLLERLWLETRADAPLAAASVWAVAAEA